MLKATCGRTEIEGLKEWEVLPPGDCSVDLRIPVSLPEVSHLPGPSPSPHHCKLSFNQVELTFMVYEYQTMIFVI